MIVLESIEVKSKFRDWTENLILEQTFREQRNI
jgi:hypothetical protein